MGLYKRRVAVVEAWQWSLGQSIDDLPEWLRSMFLVESAWVVNHDTPFETLHIKAQFGFRNVTRCSSGDYLLRKTSGVVTVMSEVVFNLSYEAVAPAPTDEPLCEWRQTAPGAWVTTCGLGYSELSSIPFNTHFTHCPRCGGVIVRAN